MINPFKKYALRHFNSALNEHSIYFFGIPLLNVAERPDHVKLYVGKAYVGVSKSEAIIAIDKLVSELETIKRGLNENV